MSVSLVVFFVLLNALSNIVCFVLGAKLSKGETIYDRKDEVVIPPNYDGIEDE